MSDEHVSIARMEAKYFFNDRKLLGKDINRLERLCYVKGRTAKPCEEQIEAVARVLRDTFAWNHVEAPERVKDYHGLAREVLDAARKAVM